MPPDEMINAPFETGMKPHMGFLKNYRTVHVVHSPISCQMNEAQKAKFASTQNHILYHVNTAIFLVQKCASIPIRLVNTIFSQSN